MKFKKIMMLTILLMILTVGAVNASDDNTTDDTLTIEDDTNDLIINSEDKQDYISVADPNLNAEINDITYGEPLNINANVENDATGTITVTINGESSLNNVSDGKVNFIFPEELNAGNYSAKIYYSGDGVYSESTIYVPFLINKAVPVLNINVTDHAEEWENISFSMKMEPFWVYGNVSIFDGEEFMKDTFINGTGFTVLSGLDPGYHTIITMYWGNENYEPVTCNNTILISDSESDSMSTFEDLQSLIDSTPENTILILTTGYISTGQPIRVNKNITIDGKGYTLYGEGLSSILYINATGCTITNLTLCNASTTSSPAIEIVTSDCTIKDCVIENITGIYSAININGDFGVINGVSIINSSITSNGGAITLQGSYCNIINSTFINTTANNGGAIYITGKNITVSDSYFSYSTSKTYGGAITWQGTGGLIKDSIFYHSSANQEGGIIYWSGNDGVIIDSVFSEGSSKRNGGAIYSPANSCVVMNSVFNGNTAIKGGAIYNCTYVNCNFTDNSNPQVYPKMESSIIITVNDIEVENKVVVVITTNNHNLTSDNITVLINDVQHVVEGSNGLFNVTIDKILVAGFYTVNVSSVETEWYNSAVNSTNFTVYKHASEINVTANNIYVGEDALIIVYIPVDGMLNVTVVGGDSYPVVVGNGSGILNIGGLIAGGYFVDVNFAGNDLYLPASGATRFTVLKYKATITVNANNCNVGEDLTVNITLPADITGTVTLRLTGEGGGNMTSSYGPYSVDIINGKGSKTIQTTNSGTYTISVIFAGNDKYQSCSDNTEKVTIGMKSKDTLALDIEKNSDEGYLSITVPSDVTGNLTLNINGTEYSIRPGSNKIDLTGFETGNYTFTITYPGDGKYELYNESDHIYLSKTVPELTMDASDTTYGQGGTVTVTVSDDVSSEVIFTLVNGNNKTIDTQNSNVVNNIATYNIPNLDVGKYTLSAQYSGDSKYYKSSLASASFNVAPKISITPDVIIGDDGIITMELGNVSGSIAVNVDGELDGSKRIADGKYIYALSTWVLTVGNHTLTFQYFGNSFDENVFNYWDNKTNSYKPIEYNFRIDPKQTETKSDSDNDNLLEIVLEDEKGNVLSNATGQVAFEIINQFTNEVHHIVVDVVNGIASLDISKFKDGNYLIIWNYLGDDKHTPISKQLSLTITHKPSRISAGDLTVMYTLSKTYSVAVYGSGGDAISGAQVTFLINNKVVKTVTTGSNGVASIAISQNPGTYQITAKVSGISVTKKLTVSHLVSLKTVKVKKSAKKLVLTASLKKVNGKYLKGKKITFKFNGKKYVAKTNKKGVAKVTVKSNVLKKLKTGKKLTYMAIYLKDTVKKSVKVKK